MNLENNYWYFKKALSKPLLMSESLLKSFSKVSEISISSIKNAFAFKLVVEKKNIFKAKIIKNIYKALKKCIVNFK